MQRFNYNGKSSDTILSEPLYIGQYNNVLEEVPYKEKELVKGESTISRPIANEYGSKYSNVDPIPLCLFKDSGKTFSNAEIRLVERWLMSPQTSRELVAHECDDTIFYYCGIFTSVKWKYGNGGICACELSFQNNSPWTYQKKTITASITGTKTIHLLCDSDEEEMYTYPTIRITKKNATGKVYIKSVTDNNNLMTINCLQDLGMIINCSQNIIMDDTTKDLITYEDLGWSDIGNIYWFRLKSGDNEIVISGDCSITFSYKERQRIVGGLC